MKITYSNGKTVEAAAIDIWDDRNTERSGFFRAYWVEEEAAKVGEANSGSPVFGLCSPGGSHRTIRAVVAELRYRGYHEPVYRNGRCIAPAVSL